MKPPPITIICDSREQRRLIFPDNPVLVTGLPVGDYSCLTFEREIAIERKNLADLFSSVTIDRARFWRELVKLSGYRYKAIVVEGRMSDASDRLTRSNANGWSVVASTLAIYCDHGIPTFWCGDPETTAKCVAWMLTRWATRGQLRRNAALRMGRRVKKQRRVHHALRY